MDFTPFLQRAKIKELLPFQQKVSKLVHTHDKIAIYAPTGSGKTLAYLFALLEADSIKKWKNAVILAPTRELAIQVNNVFKSLGTSIPTTLCYGGHPFSIERNNLNANPRLIIATPGRFLDHIRRKTLIPTDIDALIVDEEDKIHSLGFSEDVKQIKSAIGTTSLQIRVSATSEGLENTNDFFILDERKQLPAPELSYFLVKSSDEDHKALTLLKLLQSLDAHKTLIFFNHREAIERIQFYLEKQGITAITFHGGLTQEERERSLVKFSNGTHLLLLVSDLAARGIDINDIKHIIHYQFPKKEEDFIHRNGRTARMGNNGSVFSLLTPEELASVTYIDETRIKIYKPQSKDTDWETNKQTLFFSVGKKDKINKVDILGFLTKEIGISAQKIGKIDSKDFATFVCINKSDVSKILSNSKGRKIKKKTVFVAISR